MSQLAARPMSVDEFFAWQERQDKRYELVGGQPLRRPDVENLHDHIVVNLIVALRTRLRGSRYRVFTSGSSIETYTGQIRRPDVGVDCGEADAEAFKASEPRVVIEVLSPSTRDFDSVAKLAEYQSVESLTHILYVEPNRPELRVWSRDGKGGWIASIVADPDALVELPGIGIALPLSEVYADIAFPPPDRPG